MRNDCLNIIHCTKDSGDLSSVKDLQSWKTLVRVAEIRQYAPILDLTKTVGGEELPTPTYHHKCRNILWKEIFTTYVKREFNAMNQNYQNLQKLMDKWTL